MELGFPFDSSTGSAFLRESLLICIVVSDDLEYLAPHQ